MSTFEERIMKQIPKIEEGHRQKVATQQKTATEKLTKDREEEQCQEQARQMGREAVNILGRYNVTPANLIVKASHDSSSQGWHVYTAIESGYSDGLYEFRYPHGIDTEGRVFTFSDRDNAHTDQEIKNFHYLLGNRALQVVENELFLAGIASLISGYGPHAGKISK